MSRSIPGNQKHLTLDERIVIEKGLDAQYSRVFDTYILVTL